MTEPNDEEEASHRITKKTKHQSTGDSMITTRLMEDGKVSSLNTEPHAASFKEALINAFDDDTVEDIVWGNHFEENVLENRWYKEEVEPKPFSSGKARLYAQGGPSNIPSRSRKVCKNMRGARFGQVAFVTYYGLGKETLT